MADPPLAPKKRRKVRYTIDGKTVFYVVESSSGFVVGLGDVAPTDARRFHMTTVAGPKGFRSHITDQTGKEPSVPIPTKPREAYIPRLVRLAPYIRKYRRNEVAWLPIGETARRLEAVTTPERVGKKDVVPIERMRERIPFDLGDPTQFRKLRLTDIAALSKFGFRIDDGRLFIVAPSKDGAVLKVPARRMQSVAELILEIGGLDFNAYFAHVDPHWPDAPSKTGKARGRPRRGAPA